MSKYIFKDMSSKLGKGRTYAGNMTTKGMFIYVMGTFRHAIHAIGDTGYVLNMGAGKRRAYMHYDSKEYVGPGTFDIKSCMVYDQWTNGRMRGKGEVKGLRVEIACMEELEKIVTKNGYNIQIVHLLGKLRYKGIGDLALFPGDVVPEWKNMHKNSILGAVDVVGTYAGWDGKNTTKGLHTRQKDIVGLYERCAAMGFPIAIAFSARGGGKYFQYMPLNPYTAETYFIKPDGSIRRGNLTLKGIPLFPKDAENLEDGMTVFYKRLHHNHRRLLSANNYLEMLSKDNS